MIEREIEKECDREGNREIDIESKGMIERERERERKKERERERQRETGRRLLKNGSKIEFQRDPLFSQGSKVGRKKEVGWFGIHFQSPF